MVWALLLARIFEILPLRCGLCGAQMRLIAFVTDPPVLTTILAHLGEPTTPPEVARARGPALWEPAPEPLANRDESPAPVPEFVFDQRVMGWTLPSPRRHRVCQSGSAVQPPSERGA
jgi:hypothetical protein